MSARVTTSAVACIAIFGISLCALHTLILGRRPSAAVLPILVVLGFATVRLPTELRNRGALACASAYLSLLFAQPFLPLVAGTVVRVPFDTPFLRDNVEIARAMRARGEDAAPLIYPALWLDHSLPGPTLFPVSGVSATLTVLCEERPDAPVVYTSDAHGFRNAPGAGAAEWGAIGDSFTHGECVDAGRGFVDLMARRLGKALNLGMSGDGPLIELATLKEYLSPLRPRTVVWFFYPGNDLDDLDRESSVPILSRYLEDGFGQGLAERGEEIDRRLRLWLQVEEGRRTKPELTALLDGDTSSLERFLDFATLAPLRRALLPSPARHDFGLFGRVMAEAQRTVQRWGGRLVFVYLPDHVAVPDLPVAARADRDRTLAVVRGLGIPVVDVEDSLRSVDRSRLFYRPTSHYSEQGNALVAEATAAALLDRR